jgi:hypothetical protein
LPMTVAIDQDLSVPVCGRHQQDIHRSANTDGRPRGTDRG